MKLSEYKDEKALEVIANLIEPMSAICADKTAMAAIKKSRASGVAELLKTHTHDVLAVMAAFECIPVEEYHVNLLTLPKKLLELANDPDLQNLFTFAEQQEDGKSCGSASESTKA